MRFNLFFGSISNYTFLLMCSCLSYTLQSQNLVINGSMENSDGHCSFWTTSGVTDTLPRRYLFIDESACLKFDFDETEIPHKVINRYKRLVLFDTYSSESYTAGVLAARFQCPLQANEVYAVSMEIRDRFSNVEWRKIGLVVTNELLYTSLDELIYSNEPNNSFTHILNSEVPDSFLIGKIFSKFKFNYTAKGGEKYLYIGNVNCNTPSRKLIKKCFQKYGRCSSEYDVDNVEVKPLNPSGDCFLGKENNAIEALCLDTIVTLEDVMFTLGSYELSSISEIAIKNIVDYLKIQPLVYIVILGHTDNLGTLEYNLELSQSRADAVKGKLIALGIAPHRIATAGVGSAKPIADNSDESGRSKNRRVEVMFNLRD